MARNPTLRRYRIILHKKVLTEDSRQFDPKTREKIKAKCIDLLSYHPDQVGQPLRFDLKAYRKLKIFNDYRIVYRIDETKVSVLILAVGIRRGSEVYTEAVKRISQV